jgi:site-specific DNA-methyltransferase (adenine-specific)
MKTAPLSSILIKPNRQRREFNQTALAELSASIQQTKFGLLHPIVCRVEGTSLVLVAGERRFRAISDISDLGGTFNFNGAPVPPGQIPYVDLGELSELEAEEAELEENIRRVDLTWQERAQATAKLMELRKLQAAHSGLPPPTVASIAAEVRPDSNPSYAHTATREELILSNFLHDPEVAKAPTAKEGMKIIKQKEEARQNTALAVAIGQTFTSAAHTLAHESCLAWMPKQAAGQFDVILTDPPYGMGADSFGDSGVGVVAKAHFYDDSYEAWTAMMPTAVKEMTRLCKPEAHAYVFCAFENFEDLHDYFTINGWKVFKTPLIWNNPDGYRAPWPDKGPQRKYECILFAVRGGKLAKSLRGDVLTFRKDISLGHPAQKPVNLLIDLLSRSASPGDKVLDPFAGSGSTLEAGHQLKLAVSAVEENANAYGIMLKRMQEITKQKELPV